MRPHRRHFLGSLAAVGAATRLPAGSLLASTTVPGSPAVQADKIDLAPAKWIWFPSERTLPNTFVLFRRELTLDAPPKQAQGWITADSRYRLMVNGEYVQRGIAPCDPRWMDVDPVDIGSYLRVGLNTLGVEVFYFGTGERMWVAGNPGLLLSLELDFSEGRRERLLSDESWLSYVDRRHRLGQYRRWVLRGLQENFDARLHPRTVGTTRGTPPDRAGRRQW